MSMLRKSLFLILAFALVSVPVFLMAHAFTHFAQIDGTGISGEEGDDADLDEICVECLTLTTLNIILIAVGFCLNPPSSRRRLSRVITACCRNSNFSFYQPRAPPHPCLTFQMMNCSPDWL